MRFWNAKMQPYLNQPGQNVPNMWSHRLFTQGHKLFSNPCLVIIVSKKLLIFAFSIITSVCKAKSLALDTKIQIYLHRLHLSCLAPPRYHQHQQPPPRTQAQKIRYLIWSPPQRPWWGQVRSAQSRWRHSLDGGPKRHDPPSRLVSSQSAWVPAWPLPSSQLSAGLSEGTRLQHKEAEACGEIMEIQIVSLFIPFVKEEGHTVFRKVEYQLILYEAPFAFS